MISIAKHQLIDGIRDAKFLFLAAVVLAAFVANAFIYTERHKLAMEDWQENIENTTQQLSDRADSLLEISSYAQRMVKPPSVLTFIADGGEEMLPNRLLVNAFTYGYPDNLTRGNEMFELLPGVDWIFIVGTLMSLLAVMLGFGSICGEKRDGTLRQLLSYPVSRFTLFMGKYVGLLAVLVITLVLGAAINLAILYLNGILPVSIQVASIIGWALILSILFLSLVLLLGMAVSAMAHRPAISLVILMVVWLIAMVAVPGMARLFGENTVAVPSPFEVDQDIEDSFLDIWSNAPKGAGNWDDDPRYAFSEPARRRAETVSKIVFERTRIMTDAMNECVRQAESIRNLYCASPAFLMENALQKLCGNGISGFKSFFENAQRYHTQLKNFTVNKDAADLDSPHTVYSWGFSATDNTFSMKPVEFSTFPRYHTLWREGGLYEETDWPWFHILIFIGINLAAAAVAFFALARYDPR